MSDMEAEVEEVSFLPGEKILNKKAVYEPTSSQRCRQLICSRRWAIAILVIMGLFILTIALIAAFARPGSILCQEHKVSQGDRPSLIETTKLPDTGKTYLATNGQLFPWKDIRLPRSILPDTYKIFLHPNISESVFSGRVTINASVVDNTDFIIFHVKDLNITSVKVLRGEVEVVVSDELEYKQNEQYYVKVRERLPSESRITIIITFSGALVNKLGGFYKSSYKTSDGQTREIATTHFEPTDARTAFPCFDEPDMKANFTLSVIREKRHVALFNMPLLSTSDFDKGLLKDDFMMSVKMSTYLVAFIICDFKNVSAYTKQNILVRVFAPEEQISQAKFALDVAVKVLDYYDDFFGVPYPLPKQDMIAIPDFAAGAMENWGLITYRMTSILYDPQLTSASGKQWIAIVVAHELAHQWFGNLVTMKWWDDLWLNEGFASFVEYIGADVAEPEFHMKEQFISDSLQNALYLDSFSNSHPILVTVQDPSEINEIFDKISYDKGACLIRMLEGFVGEQQFKAGLSQYLRTRSYSNAQTADLWEAIQNAGDKEIHPTVAEVMDTWTLQMGYPVVTVTRQPGSNVLYLTQSRFLMGKQSGEEGKIKSPYNYTWMVPFTYVTSQDPKTQNMQWMNMDKANITVSENVAWIKGNYMSRGFYRVNYEESLWRDIIKQLIDNHTVFSTEDRAGLIDDAFNLARAGLLKYDIVFELLSYMMKETEYVPWLTAISSYDFIDDRMYLTDIYPLLQKYMLGLINNQLSTLGWNPPRTHLDQLQQMMMLGFATSLDHKPAIEEGKKKFELWKVNKTSILQNQISLACKLGVEYGDEETWQYVWNQYVSSTVPTEKRQLLGALTSSRDPRRLQMFLQDSLNDSKVRSQDSDSVIQGIASNSVGQIFAWRFLQRNWDTIFKRYGQTSFLLGEILKGVISPFNTQFDYDEVQKFFADKEMGSGSMALKQSLETVQMHIDWNNKYAQGDWTAKLTTGKPPMRRARTEF